MYKYNMIIRRALVIVLFIFSAQSAFALLTILNPEVTDLSGNGVSNASLELLTGGSASTPSPAKAPYSSGTLYTSQFSNTGGNGISPGNLAVTESGLAVVLKAWKGTPGPGSYYGFQSGSSGGDRDTFRWDPAKIMTNFKAAPPYTPVIKRFEETSTTYSDGRKEATLKVVAGEGAVTDGKREGSTYAWQMGEAGGNISNVAGATGTTLTLSSDQVSPGTTYTFKINCTGPWGTSDWAEENYTVSGAGGPGGMLTFPLLASQSDKLVVNPISVPTGLTETKASGLIKLINRKAGREIVIALGRWDPIAGLAEGYNPKTGEGTDFNLRAGEGYQLYVTDDFTLVLP